MPKLFGSCMVATFPFRIPNERRSYHVDDTYGSECEALGAAMHHPSKSRACGAQNRFASFQVAAPSSLIVFLNGKYMSLSHAEQVCILHETPGSAMVHLFQHTVCLLASASHNQTFETTSHFFLSSTFRHDPAL